MNISKLQYITPQPEGDDFFDLIKSACELGCDWIQLRVKDKPEEEYLYYAQQCASICKQTGVTFIINDNVEIARMVDADGVHLGKRDMSPSKARDILGNKIIGGTANTFEDLKLLVSEGVDYIGLGPFRYTTTKKNLSPILGLDGYRDIFEQCRRENISIPIVTIGGIVYDDISSIMKTGAYGIAASGFITNQVRNKERIQINF